MPQFEPGTTKNAKVKFTNPKGVTLSYIVSLYMGTNQVKMAQSSFSIGAGQEKQVSLSVTMPSTTGYYPVYLGVTSGGQTIAWYQAGGVTISWYWAEPPVPSNPDLNPSHQPWLSPDPAYIDILGGYIQIGAYVQNGVPGLGAYAFCDYRVIADVAITSWRADTREAIWYSQVAPTPTAFDGTVGLHTAWALLIPVPGIGANQIIPRYFTIQYNIPGKGNRTVIWDLQTNNYWDGT